MPASTTAESTRHSTSGRSQRAARFARRLRIMTASAALVVLAACGTDAGNTVAGSTGQTGVRSTSPSESPDQQAATLSCSKDFDKPSTLQPVLLIHGSALDSEVNWSWNWIPAFNAEKRPWCTVDLFEKGTGDAQVSGERVAYAINAMAQRVGRPIALVGYSQGGLLARFALKYFPEARTQVSEVISIAGSHHGTVLANGVCSLDGCAAAFWQQRNDSQLIAALNANDIETFPGISYTSIFSRYDQIVVPNFDSPATAASSALKSSSKDVRNILMQDVCPNNFSDHLQAGTSDALAYRLAMDALTNPGPADPARLSATVCAEPYMPGVNPATLATDYARLGAAIGQNVAAAPRVKEEPALRTYVRP